MYKSVSVILFAAFLLWKSAPQLARAENATDDLMEGFTHVEAASVADAMEQLYGRKMYMFHGMRPLFTTKFAGPAVTVLLHRRKQRRSESITGHDGRD